MPKLIKVTLQYVQSNAEADWYVKIIEQSDRTKGIVGKSDDDIITVDICNCPDFCRRFEDKYMFYLRGDTPSDDNRIFHIPYFILNKALKELSRIVELRIRLC